MCVYPKLRVKSACSAPSAPHPCLAPSHPKRHCHSCPSSSTSSCQSPQKLAAPAEPQQPSQTVPCASHAKSSRPNPSHNTRENFLHAYQHTPHAIFDGHQPSQTAVRASHAKPSCQLYHQPCHCCQCCARSNAKATQDPMFSPFANGHAARRPDARKLHRAVRMAAHSRE